VRVTDKMMFEAANTRTAKSRSDMDTATEQASTGLRVQHPWDDPSAAGQVVNHRLGVNRFDAIGTTAKRAADELGAVDGALGQITELLARSRELVVQLSNDTYSAEDRRGAAAETSGLSREMLALLNTRFGNRYVFGGNLDDTPPFDAGGNYLGDAGVRKVEIAPGEVEDASVRADVFAKGVGGGADIPATLTAITTALTNNDVTTLRAQLDTLDRAISQVSVARSTAGGAMNLFDLATETARLASDSETTAASRLTEVDQVAAASKLALAQRALDAALTASAQSFRLTLLDKLG
jgi:flagellar hook-associated protein 3 FlgL